MTKESQIGFIWAAKGPNTHYVVIVVVFRILWHCDIMANISLSFCLTIYNNNNNKHVIVYVLQTTKKKRVCITYICIYFFYNRKYIYILSFLVARIK